MFFDCFYCVKYFKSMINIIENFIGYVEIYIEIN